MSTALTRESLIEVPRWVTAFNFPIIGCSDSPPDHHCPPPFVLFVYFPSHPFSRSLLLPSFFLSLLILVQSRPLSPIFFPSYWYSPTDIRLFSNCHLYFLIFQFPVFLVFSLVYLIAYHLLLPSPFSFSPCFIPRLSRFLRVHFAFCFFSFHFLSSFMYSFSSLLSFFLSHVPLVLFPLALPFPFARILFPFHPHPSRLSPFFSSLVFISSACNILLSNSGAAVVLVCIPRVPLRTRWFRNCSLIVSAWGTLGASS